MSTFSIPTAVRLVSPGSRFPASARTSVVLGGLVAAAAFAAPALAAVGDRIPFQEFKSKACRSAGICSTDFSAVPANARLEVNSVSCFLFRQRDLLNAGATLEFAVLNAAGKIVMSDYGVPRDAGHTDFGHFHAVNNKTFFLAPPGGRIRVVMVSTNTTGMQLDCKIAGEQVIVR